MQYLLTLQVSRYHIFALQSSILLCKAKRRYLLTLQVSRYCILALHISIIGDGQRTEPRRVCDQDQDVIHLEFILSNSEPK